MISRVFRIIFALLLLAPGELAAAPDLVILVRHAEKEALPADNPHLNAAGRERAAELAKVVAVFAAKIPLRGIFTTEFLRTRETAAPAAAAFHIAPVATNEDIVAKVRAVAGGTVLIVGHSNTVPGLIQALGGPAGVSIGDSEFNHLYVLAAPGTLKVKFAALAYGN
jgi:broad specificity phosphatase PhoE